MLNLTLKQKYFMAKNSVPPELPSKEKFEEMKKKLEHKEGDDAIPHFPNRDDMLAMKAHFEDKEKAIAHDLDGFGKRIDEGIALMQRQLTERFHVMNEMWERIEQVDYRNNMLWEENNALRQQLIDVRNSFRVTEIETVVNMEEEEEGTVENENSSPLLVTRLLVTEFPAETSMEQTQDDDASAPTEEIVND